MADYKKPLPAITTLNGPYWDGLKRRELKMPKCKDCGNLWYPPAPFCPACWSRNFTWRQLSGRGKVNSWVVFHQAYFSSYKDDIAIGMPVEIVYDDVTEDVTLAKFRPATKS